MADDRINIAGSVFNAGAGLFNQDQPTNAYRRRYLTPLDAESFTQATVAAQSVGTTTSLPAVQHNAPADEPTEMFLGNYALVEAERILHYHLQDLGADDGLPAVFARVQQSQATTVDTSALYDTYLTATTLPPALQLTEEAFVDLVRPDRALSVVGRLMKTITDSPEQIDGIALPGVNGTGSGADSSDAPVIASPAPFVETVPRGCIEAYKNLLRGLAP
jgi:hypothetical protein